MKKLLSLSLALILAISLVSCNKQATETPATETPVTETPADPVVDAPAEPVVDVPATPEDVATDTAPTPTEPAN